MGTCIICGSSVDGRVCELHEEDVVFEFKGTNPDQLTPNRYYRGTVDGFAEFGIFVDIGDNVTGLLHKSELDRRLDSVDLEPGDTIFVQVQHVRDNGNVDLGWSIRQDQTRFRGALVHDPEEGDRLPEDERGEDSRDTEPVRQRAQQSTPDRSEDQTSSNDQAGQEADEPAVDESTPDPTEVTISELGDHVGKNVRIEGEIQEARQTSGPTVFGLRDETGAVECAAFEEAGVRAYPEVDEGDIVRIEGEVEERRGDLQVETEALVVLEAEERDAVTERMQEALVQRARPETIDPLADDPVVDELTDEITDAATAIRRAVIEGRPIVVRHAASADGYVASVAIERATLPLISNEQQGPDVEYHYFERRPIEGSIYTMNDATRDVTKMLSDKERHDEQFPLFVFVAAGGTAESLDGFDLLDVYGARRVVIDPGRIDDEIADAVDVLVSPQTDTTTATVLGATVASAVNPDVRDDLVHLPAVSFWDAVPAQYSEIAADAGYDEADVSRLREAVALEAFYQSYEDKRELIVDLLFADEAEDPMGLAEHISEQFRERIETAIETAEANLERQDGPDGDVLILDTDAYTHRFEFPPVSLLLDHLFRQHNADISALVGFGTDEAFVRSTAALDVRAVAAAADEAAPEAAITARGTRNGRLEYLAGERETAKTAIVDALFDQLKQTA